jgi:hypothetical protein
MRRPVTLLCCLLVAGCTADRPDTTPSPTPAPSPTCPASAQITASANGLERQGVGTDATLWALFFSAQATASQEIKIAWRMTGAGDLTMTATGPDGKTLNPVWGPELHGGSSYRRPGDEWGTGWVFPTAGCWTVNAARTTGRAQLAIRVG